jgi:hypothetical protein
MQSLELSRSSKWMLELGNHVPSAFLRPFFRTAEAALRRRPGSGWSVLQELDVPRAVREKFEQARSESGPFALPMSIVTPPSPFPVKMRVWAEPQPLVLDIQDSDALQLLGSVVTPTAERDWHADGRDALAEQLRSNGLIAERSTPRLRCEEPGIYRLQHACLLFRTKSTSVLVDPVSYHEADYWLDPRDVFAPDAILISHSHLDHFCLATLLHFAKDTPIVVPIVETPSLLAADMAGLLRAAGFTNVIAAPWFSRHQFGDIEVNVFPFYGEQPWLSFPAPWPSFRNAGNTYGVRLGEYTTWVLIDSGAECGAAMIDLCERVREVLGGVDIVLSNVREFSWHAGQIDGSGRYLFCFPMDQLERPDTWPDNRLMTLGPSGIRRLLAEVQARHFLPYAHWWHDRSTESTRVESLLEHELVATIARSSEKSMPMLRTTFLDWKVGDAVRGAKGRKLSVDSALRKTAAETG